MGEVSAPRWGERLRIAVASAIALSAFSLDGAADPADTQPQTETPPSASWPMPPASPTPGVAPPTVPAPLPLLPAGASQAVLYEEDTSNPTGYRWAGSAIWRAETVSPGQGKPAELAVRADIEIPKRRMGITWTLRRATDLDSASHTVDISFKLPPRFPSGGIRNVPAVMMKETEQGRGVPLAGLTVKVTTGFFLIGLSNNEADREKNMRLLNERPWFDIPIVYTNNRRAILALEKGVDGERAFAQAFAEWGK
jgi:hypothetical protein